MKRSITIFTIVLTLLFGMTTLAHAWGSPKHSFNRNVDRALKKERWKKPDEAREYWLEVVEDGNKLLAESPGEASSLLGTARAHYGLGEYAESAQLYEELLATATEKGVPNLPKTYPWAYVYLGLSYAKLGNTEKALEYWKQVPMNIGGVYTTIQEQIAELEGGK